MTMNRAAIALVCSLVAYSASAADLGTELTQALAGSQTPAVAALKIKDGKVVDEAARGVKRNDQAGQVTNDDIWATGSDGKPMTAALIARLVDRGTLSWDAPLAKMLPELADTMRPEYRGVTLVQLLSHRAGLAHDTNDIDFFNSFFHDSRPLPAQRLAYLRQALTEAPVAKPGEKFEYSNTGFVVAAAVAEHATGESYEALMQREIFTPLGMKSARFAPTATDETHGHLHGKPANVEDGNPLMLAPAGAELHLSLTDWAKFCLDQLAGAHGQGKLLSTASYHLMQTAQADSSAGLGWGVRDSFAGRQGPVLMHAGTDGNWYALVALFPATGSGAIVAANAGEEMGGDKVTRVVMTSMLPDLAPAK